MPHVLCSNQDPILQPATAACMRSRLLLASRPCHLTADGDVCAALSCLACRQHYYQQMRKEADKQWPSKNKKLDFVLALAHGT